MANAGHKALVAAVVLLRVLQLSATRPDYGATLLVSAVFTAAVLLEVLLTT